MYYHANKINKLMKILEHENTRTNNVNDIHINSNIKMSRNQTAAAFMEAISFLLLLRRFLPGAFFGIGGKILSL